MTTQSVTCPREESWRALLAGALPAAEEAELHRHLESCPRCAGLCEELTPSLPLPLVAELRAALLTSPHAPSLADTRTALDSPTNGGGGAGGPHEEAPPGTRIGQYRVTRLLGVGGMGCVVAAEDDVLRRSVAIKIPSPRLADSLEGRARFLREARAAGKLQHPNICAVHEVGEWRDRPYLVMNYIAGQTLAAWAKAVAPEPEAVARVVAAMARGVAHAHALGVVHRDIKPSNAMIEDESQRVVLTDFGLARDSQSLDVSLTASGQVLGTPCYMAPEQAAGDHAAVGPATDVYALGTVLYELLAGRPPFAGTFGEVLRAVQADDPPPLGKANPRLPHALRTICERAMQKSPAARYPSAQALADDLERFLRGESIWARPDAWWQKAVRSGRKRRGTLLAAAAFAAACLIVVFILARSAATARHTSQLAQKIERELQATTWDAQHVAQVDALIEELSALAPQHPSADPRRVTNALRASLHRDLLEQPRLDAALVQAAAPRLALLDGRDAAAGTEFRARLAERLSAWQLAWRFGPFAEDDLGRFTGEAGVALAASIRDGWLELPAASPGTAAQQLQGPELARANIRLQAVLANRFPTDAEVGLFLASRGGSRYTFRVIPANPERAASDEPGEVSIPTSTSLAVIERDGDPLFSRWLNPASGQSPSAELWLVATIEGRRLAFQVGEHPPLEFIDLFESALGDALLIPGLLAPPGARVREVSAEVQAEPRSASPMERGDAHFSQRQWQAALEEYQRQRTSDGLTGALRDELEYKRALCLAALERPEEAAAALGGLLRSRDDAIRRAAEFQLWLVHLRQEQFDMASVLFSAWTPADVAQIVRLAPQSAREEVAARIFGRAIGEEALYVAPDELDALRRAQAIGAIEWGDPHGGAMRVLQLVRGFHAAGEHEEGLHVLRQYLEPPRPEFGPVNVDLWEERAWMLRSVGRDDEALAAIETALTIPPTATPNWRRLLLERARLRAARGEWTSALSDADAFLREPLALQRYFHYSSAHMLRGFCLLHLERTDEAEAAWRAATCRAWRAAAGVADDNLTLTGLPLGNALLSAMLARELPAAELEIWLRATHLEVRFPGIQFAVRQFGGKFVPFIATVRDDPAALAELERAALLKLSLTEYMREPFCFAGLLVARGALGGADWSPAERGALRAFFAEGVTAFGRGEVTFGMFVQALAAWEGVGGELGWEGLLRSVPDRLRGTSAFLLGCRFVSQADSAAARQLLEVACAELPPDSALVPRAQAKLAELPGAAP